MFWKIVQLAVFIGLAGWIHSHNPDATGLAAGVLALGIMVLIWAPILHLKAWWLARKKRIDAGPR